MLYQLNPSPTENIANMRKLPPNKVDDATQQLRQGKSPRQVARALGISHQSAIRIRNSDKENIPEPHPGRPKKITETTMRAMARQYNIGVLKSNKDGKRFVESTQGNQIHVNTVRRNLIREGVKKYSQPNKPNLTNDQIARRLKFAKDHIHWTVDDWKRVMFSDETVISRFGNFGKSYYHCRPEHRALHRHQIKPTL